MIYRPSLWARVSRNTICSRFIFKYSQWARRSPAARLPVSRSRVVLRVVPWFTVNDLLLICRCLCVCPCMLPVTSSRIHAVRLPGWRRVVLLLVPYFTVFHRSLFVLIRIWSDLCDHPWASCCLFSYTRCRRSWLTLSSCWYFHYWRFTIARSLSSSGSGMVFILIVAYFLLYLPVFTQCQ